MENITHFKFPIANNKKIAAKQFQINSNKDKHTLLIFSHGFSLYNSKKDNEILLSIAKVTSFNLIAYDYINFGKSTIITAGHINPWEQIIDLSQIVTHFSKSYQNIILIGFSYGALHSLFVSEIVSVSGLILVAPYLGTTLSSTINRRMSLFKRENEHILDSSRYKTTKVLHRNNQNSIIRANNTKQFLPDNWKNHVTLQSIEMLSHYSWNSKKKSINKTNSLIIHQTNDATCSTEQLENLKSYMPNIQIHKLSKGHFSFFKCHDLHIYTSLIKDWISNIK
jgi:pimeloyl-ACP methyl ester carboxylesterase